MAFNDALSDMLARIKNAHKARKSFTSCYKSKLNSNVLNVLKAEGYIRDFKDIEVNFFSILLKFEKSFIFLSLITFLEISMI